MFICYLTFSLHLTNTNSNHCTFFSYVSWFFIHKIIFVQLNVCIFFLILRNLLNGLCRRMSVGKFFFKNIPFKKRFFLKHKPHGIDYLVFFFTQMFIVNNTEIK